MNNSYTCFVANLAILQPYIIKAFDLVLSEDQMYPWLIMEYIPDCLHIDTLTEPNSVQVLTHLTTALEYLHERG